MAGTYDIELKQGETFLNLITIPGFNLSGYTIQASIRKDDIDKTAVADFTSQVIDVSAGKFTLELAADVAASLTSDLYNLKPDKRNAVIGSYDVRLSNGTNVYYPLQGKITLVKSVV